MLPSVCKHDHEHACQGVLGGSWDLVSEVISTLIGIISIVTLIITLVTKSHDPLSSGVTK